MIGRDKITVHSQTETGTEVDQVVYGLVVTEETVGELTPLGSAEVFRNWYRIILPASLDLSDAHSITVSWADRHHMRLETAITPIYLHGRVHHYEAVVKAS